MPSWRTWSFLQINISPEKPWKNKKLHLHPKKVFFKMFFRSLKFRFPHPCRKRLQTSGISSFKISKQSQNYFFSWKKPFVPKCFPRNMDCCFDKPAKIVLLRNRNFSILAQNHTNLVCDKFFCSNCSSVHVECLPGSSRFHLKCLWIRSCQFDTTSGYFCQESGTHPLNVGKRI